MKGNFGVTPNRALIAQRRRKALEMLTAGYRIADILREVPEYKTKKALEEDLRKVLTAMVDRPAKAWLGLHIERHERLLNAVWEAAMSGDLNAHNRALQTLESEGKLLKLQTTTVEVDSSDVGRWLTEMLTSDDEISEEEI